MSFVIAERLEIAAPPECVWEVISDFASYGDWNPFVVACESSLEVDAPIDMRVEIFPGIRQSQREYIFACEPGRSFTYGVRPMPLGAMQSQRSHLIEPTGDSCAYSSRFELGGWLAPLVRALVGRRLESGFGAMSHGIKARAEDLIRERSPQ
jgi:hypothetical protein